jgi:diadenosine tetraphosphate (Ap4A) HIT family hydrolase
MEKKMPYDSNNIFARMLRKEIPYHKVFESPHVLAFYDINPKAPCHVLVIPKGPYVSWADFSEKATSEEISEFVKSVDKITQDLGLQEKGYRLISNHGAHASQEVPHFHLHILGGEPLGPLLSNKK